MNPETCKSPWLWVPRFYLTEGIPYIVIIVCLRGWWQKTRRLQCRYFGPLYQFNCIYLGYQTDLESKSLIWSAQSGNGFCSNAFILALVFLGAGLTFRQTISFFDDFGFPFGWGLFASAPNDIHLMGWLFDCFGSPSNKVFCRNYAVLLSDRKWSREMVSSSNIAGYLEITFGVITAKPGLDDWSLWRVVCWFTAVNYFHHTSGGRKRGYSYWKSEAKLKKRANFFKVYWDLFLNKEKYPVSLTFVLIYRLGNHNWSRWLHLSFSMKRSMEDWQSALLIMALIYEQWELSLFC